MSEDTFHSEDTEESTAKHAVKAAKKLGIPSSIISVDRPTIESAGSKERVRGEPIVGGGVMFRGRAVGSLTEGLPGKNWQDFAECPYEDLRRPKRVHVDPMGNVHICQGLSMGNMWKTPLSELVRDYDCDSHPICAPLARGGPALLSEEFGVGKAGRYVDACHLCYLTRLALLDEFPQYLAPKQVYGLEGNG